MAHHLHVLVPWTSVETSDLNGNPCEGELWYFLFSCFFLLFYTRYSLFVIFLLCSYFRMSEDCLGKSKHHTNSHFEVNWNHGNMREQAISL